MDRHTESGQRLQIEEESLRGLKLTFDTDAVNTTTSYNSPMRFMNWSTPGRLIT